ncbi:hypothetical protein FACS1894151_09970 [Spirochaetia bacterium]|nr:hypothetical protein FACS1894151_09970 [Spirochaetia bacterium]
MNCHDVMDKLYDALGGGMPTFVEQLEIRVHLLFCPDCAEAASQLEIAKTSLREDFFPSAADMESSPGGSIEDSIMLKIAAEEFETGDLLDKDYEETGAPAGVSLRGWVITGCIVLVSLSTSFFGMDFNTVASTGGDSFLLPMGITIGAVITSYGALFIASHLKELSNRFGLHDPH